MRRALLLALAALPLAAFDCGGSDPAPTACTVTVAGEVGERLWCVAAITRPNPAMSEWLFDLAAYRGQTEVGGGVGITFAAKPSTGTAYGWDSAVPTSSVEAGSATRYDGTMSMTHDATAPFGDAGTGELSITFTALPTAETGPDTVNVHGSFTATLPSTTGGAPVTFTGSF